MESKKQKYKQQNRNTCYNKLPTRVSRKEFNRHVRQNLLKGKRGPKPKISFYKVFNYILYVLHTGIQWRELKAYHNEISWQEVYHYHNRWSKDGSYGNLFLASVSELDHKNKLDLSILHGDGSNTVAKKGEKK